MNKNKIPEIHFGFLSIVKIGSSSFVGGYLLLNALGRPTEFHCTEAIKPTRAQEILYGSTLEGYLYSDLLGRSLLSAAKTKPIAIFVDASAALDLTAIVDATILLVLSETTEAAGFREITVGRNRICSTHVQNGESDIPEEVLDRIAIWDLNEPFQRIQEAIQETQKAA